MLQLVTNLIENSSITLAVIIFYPLYPLPLKIQFHTNYPLDYCTYFQTLISPLPHVITQPNPTLIPSIS